jgi:Tfp pilus assembly protein PilZ
VKRKNNLPVVNVEVVVSVKKQMPAGVKNMIDGGICLLTEKSLEKGKILTLEISYQGREKLRINGKVMWSLKIGSHYYENGIDFRFLNGNIKDELTRFFN